MQKFVTCVLAHNVPVIVLDTETTGFSPERDAVIQFSGVKGYLRPDGTFDVKDAEIKDFYIQSPIPIPKEASQVNGITDDLLQQKGAEREDALRAIYSFLKGSAVIGHNINFDLRMLNGFFAQMGEKHKLNLDSPYICDTLSAARKVVKDRTMQRPCALSNLIKRIKPDADFSFHNSLEDVYATIEVYNWLVRKMIP